jgi:hypothetical protein
MPGDETTVAWPRGSDPGTLRSRTRAAHERFLSTGVLPTLVRGVVAESWRRSVRLGVDPERPRPPVSLTDADLRAYRREHPLWSALPVVRTLLLDDAVAEGFLVALTDAQGRLLWIGGDAQVRRAVDRVGFVEGADWGEAHAGTNAPGTALATGRDVQVYAAEHFTRTVQPWSCSAALLRDPAGQVIGALDVTGGDAAASPLMLSLVRATATAVELDLRARVAPTALPSRADPSSWADPSSRTVASSPTTTRSRTTLSSGNAAPSRAASPARTVLPAGPARPTSNEPVSAPPTVLRVLGTGEATLQRPDEPAPRPLPPRHAEVLLLLAAHPAGLHADELGALLHPGVLSDVTVRAEMSRLRRTVGALVAASRPYRATGLTTDLDPVRARLSGGDVLGALLAYPGPVLPRSQAPGVEQLREALVADLRAGVLASRDLLVLETWVDRPDGAEDWQAWERLVELSAPGSATRARARARLALLVRRLGPGPAAHPWA